MDQALDMLKRYYGYPAFRPGQRDIIDRLLTGRDVLAVMPTGAGKSICFQIPALCLSGITLVVSPLISLMKDQVSALIQAGVPAAYLNSSLTERQFGLALQNARTGKYKIIYVAPERLEAPSFRAFAQAAHISLVAVDEAHCVSQWGQDFRPSYLAISEFVSSLPSRPVVGAFTATATPQVRQDIMDKLDLQDPYLTVSGFDRPNLRLSVDTPASKKEALLAFLRLRPGTSGIIYCATRKLVEEICDFLAERSFSAARYHAGLEADERNRNQEAFIHDQAAIMVATNAFGMGIDKPDVRWVVHYNMPKDLESYYQEAGRAGRDGDPADCLLLYSPSDVRTNQFLIELRDEEREPDEESYQARVVRDKERLRQMTIYCRTTDCLRGYLMRYFGEHAGLSCGNCSNCLTHFTEEDITTDAQKILSCVARTGQRYGAGMIADILRGANTERIRLWRLNQQSTYGLMAGYTLDQVHSRVQRLLEAGYLTQSEGPYPTLALTDKANDILYGGARLTALVKAAPAKADKKRADSPTDPQLFKALQELRAQLARKQGVPAYVIFADKTLREMCQVLPRTEAQLLDISGVGESKLRRYGKQFLQVIQEWDQPQNEA